MWDEAGKCLVITNAGEYKKDEILEISAESCI